MTPRTILIPLDGSTRSRQVFDHIQKLFEPQRDRLILLQVAPHPLGALLVPDRAQRYDEASPLQRESVPQGEMLRLHAGRVVESQREELLAGLRLQARALKQAGFTVTCDGRIGESVEEIIAASDIHQADLIAMATHGRGGVRRLLMGSVAEAVLRRSSVPVLMLRSVASTQASLTAQLEDIKASLEANGLVCAMRTSDTRVEFEARDRRGTPLFEMRLQADPSYETALLRALCEAVKAFRSEVA